MARVDTLETLRESYGTPSERAVWKELRALDGHCCRFISLSPFFILCTSSPRGADASPRGGAPGFVSVPDAQTLLIPDSPGNNRLDSLENILTNPQVGLLFLIPGVNETLRVNGRAEIWDDLELRERFAVSGRLPATVLRIEVEAAYLHCAKALMRSELWAEERRLERSVLPTLGEMLSEQMGVATEPETQEAMEQRYREGLY